MGLFSAALGFLGQRSANRANSAQAARSMAFQREMAKNAHQYEVADLKKAGLNPLLSGTGGKGASASGGAQAKIENEANSAMTSRLLNAQVNATNATTNKTNQETQILKGGRIGKELGSTGTKFLGQAIDNIPKQFNSALDLNARGGQYIIDQIKKLKPKTNYIKKHNKTKTKRGYR